MAAPETRITVASPCFNDGATVVEMIESIDEREPVEVLVVDDGSTDPDTIAVLAELEVRPGIRVVRHGTNRGVPAGINTALDATRTEFMFLIGADDVLESGALAALADALAARPEAGAAWGHYEFFGARTGTRRTPPWDPWRVSYNNYWTGVAMMRRDVIRGLGGASERSLYEDWDLWMTMAEAGVPGLVVDVPMFRYRIHDRTVSVRRCATAKDNFPRDYRAMRDGHPRLFATRRELVGASSMSLPARTIERLALFVKLRLPKHLRRAVYGTAAWLETRSSRRTLAS